jgi:hypothetical protein
MFGDASIASTPIAAAAASAAGSSDNSGTTTTQVSSDLVLTWDIAARVNADLVLSWTILTEGQDMAFVPSAARTIKVLAASKGFQSNSDFWGMSNPHRPVGSMDPDGTIDISFDLSEVLADILDSIAQIEFILDGVVSAGEHADGALATIFLTAPSKPEIEITCRMTSASIPAREQDFTVALKIEEQ